MPRESKTGYITLQNFRFGLDARRSELTSQPGTLLRAVDCHVNQGAELEKRKAFVKTKLPPNTFGILATPTGLLIFGSVSQTYYSGVSCIGATYTYNHSTGATVITFVSAPQFGVGTSVSFSGLLESGLVTAITAALTGSSHVLTGNGSTTLSLTIATGLAPINLSGTFSAGITFYTLPSPFQYQQLTSPLGSAMTAIVDATLFNGKAFVAATFGSDGTFLFYDGAQVIDFTSGVVSSTSYSSLAAALVTLVGLTDNYTSTQYPNGSGATAEIIGEGGNAFDAVSTITTAAGLLTIDQVNVPSAVTPVQNAIGHFTIFAADATGAIIQVNVNNGQGAQSAGLQLNSATINFDTDEATTAKDLAINCNANVAQRLGVEVVGLSRTSNVATLVMPQDLTAFITVGMTINVTSAGQPSYNVTGGTVLSITSTALTYANTGSNDSHPSATAGLVAIGQFFTAIAEGAQVNIYGPQAAQASGWDINVLGSGGMVFNNFAFTFIANGSPNFTIQDLGLGTSSAVTTSFLSGNTFAYSTYGSMPALLKAVAAQVIASMVSWTAVQKGNQLFLGPTEQGTSFYYTPGSPTVKIDSAATVSVVVTAGNIAVAASPKTVGPANTATCNVTGGTPPYTYKWIVNNSTSLQATALTPTAKTTKFGFTPITSSSAIAGRAPTITYTCSAYCIVTDSTTPTANVVNTNTIILSQTLANPNSTSGSSNSGIK